MRHDDLTSAAWVKSSHSGGDAGQCIEIAPDLPHIVPIRDSKNPDGPALLVPAASFSAFVAAVKAGRLSSS
jgi:hypothetical protein